MHKGVIAYIAIVVVVILLWYYSTGFGLNLFKGGSTTVPNHQTTTIPKPSNKTTTVPAYQSCNGAYLFTYASNVIVQNETCVWTGGVLGLWLASGNSSYIHVTLFSSATNRTYVDVNTTYKCTALYNVYNLSSGTYTFSMNTGPESSLANNSHTCDFSVATLNMSTNPSNGTIYSNVFNGNFLSGTYAGWSVTGNAFGAAPMNFTKADKTGCYPGVAEWTGLNGSYYASTYTCAPTGGLYMGNLTSQPFLVTAPFLNFQIIGYDSPYTYIAIIYNNTPYVTADFNTYTISNTNDEYFLLRNASLPLTNVYGKIVRVKLVSKEVNQTEYIIAGNFRASARPSEQPGVLTNITIR